MVPNLDTLDSKKTDLHLKLTFTLPHLPFQFSKQNILNLTNIILSIEKHKLDLYMSANPNHPKTTLLPSQIQSFSSNPSKLWATLQPL